MTDVDYSLPASLREYVDDCPMAALEPWILDIVHTRFVKATRFCELYVRHLCLRIAKQESWGELLSSGTTAIQLSDERGYVAEAVACLEFILDQLVEAGWLTSEGEEFRLETDFPEEQSGLVANAAVAFDQRIEPTITVLSRAATHYPKFFREGDDAENILVGTRALKMWLDYFDNDNLPYRAGNQLTAEYLARQVVPTASRDGGRMRVLELGAGAGSGTRAIAEAFDSHDLSRSIASYVVSDRERTLLGMAKRRLEGCDVPFDMEYQILDFEGTWQQPSVVGTQFDVIVAINALHAATDLVATLRQLGSRIRSNGWLVLGECIRPYDDFRVYPEFFFLLLRSFRQVVVDPELRPNAGFLTPESWESLLRETGYEMVRIIPDFDLVRNVDPRFYSAVIAARPATAK